MKRVLKFILVLAIVLGVTVNVNANKSETTPYCFQPSCWEIA